MRITIFMIWFCCLTPIISYACSDEERAMMLKAGISPEYVKKSCEIEGLESQPAEKELNKSSATRSENPDTQPSMQQIAKDEDQFDASRMQHHITLMIGGMSGELEANGNSADLGGHIRQFVYFHQFRNEIIAGFRYVSMKINGNLTIPVTYTSSSEMLTTDYTTTYELEGFGFSVGRKFELNYSTTLPNLTYMTGDASISVGPFKDLVTGTGDYLAIEFPFLWSYQQILFGITPHYIIVGGSKNEDVRVKLYSAFSLQVGIAL